MFGFPLRTAAAMLLAAAPLSARAQDAPKVLLLTYQGMGTAVAPELREQTTSIVAQELSAAGMTVIRADDLVEGGAPAAGADPAAGVNKDAPVGDPLAGERAKELIARAKLSMEDQDLAAAIKQLKQAVRLLDENGDAVPDVRLLPEAYLQLAIGLFQDGDEEEADDSLSKAIHFAPDRKLDPSEYPPIFIRVYDRSRFNVLRRPRARVEINAKKGAQLLFDGRNLGKAPIVLTEVLPGTHWVRVERPGEPIQVKKLVVRGGRTLAVEFDGAEAAPAAEAEDAPVGVLGAIAKNEINRSHVAQLRTAGKRANATMVMFGGIHKTETAYNIFSAAVSVGDGEVGRLVDIAFDLDLLSAQIEVFKLSEDSKKELRKLTRLEDAPVFPLTAKVQIREKKRRVAAEETRVETVVAAPPPLEAEEPPPVAAAVPAPTRGPVAATATPVAATVGPTPKLVPKDEEGEQPKPAPAVVVPYEPEESSDEPASLWWVWVLVGVAAAGAAGAGGYLVLSNQQPDEGRLTIRW